MKKPRERPWSVRGLFVRALSIGVLTSCSVMLSGFGSCGGNSSEIRCREITDASQISPGGYGLVRLNCTGLGRGNALDLSVSSTPEEAVSAVSQAYYYPGQPTSTAYWLLVRGNPSATEGSLATLKYTIKYRDQLDGSERTGVGSIPFSFAAPPTPAFTLKASAKTQSLPASEHLTVEEGDTVVLQATDQDGAALGETGLGWLARGFTSSESDIAEGLANNGGPDFDGTKSELTDVPTTSRSYEVLALDADGALQLAQAVVEVAGKTEPLSVVLDGPTDVLSDSPVDVVASVSGGIAPYTFAWSAATLSGEEVSATHVDGATATYTPATDLDITVKVTDALAHVATSSFKLLLYKVGGNQLTVSIANESNETSGLYVRSEDPVYECLMDACSPLVLSEAKEVVLTAGTQNDTTLEVAWSGSCVASTSDPLKATVLVSGSVECTATFSELACNPAQIEPKIDVSVNGEAAPSAMLDGRLVYYVVKQTPVVLSAAQSTGAGSPIFAWTYENFGSSPPTPVVPGRTDAVTFSAPFVQTGMIATVRVFDQNCSERPAEDFPTTSIEICAYSSKDPLNANNLPTFCFGE